MKAAFIRKTGGLEVIEIGEMEKPKVGSHQLLVKTIALALAPVDNYIRAGKYVLPFKLPSPFIVGRDVVGTVEEVGDEVENFKKGDIVWSVAFLKEGEQGSAAEYVCRSADVFYHLPKGIDPTLAVASIQAAATACRAIIVAGTLKKDEILFVNGGGGNVGAALIELGKARGATVFAATTGKEKMEWCKQLGADQVFDYQKGDFKEEVKKKAPKGVDVFVETSQEPHLELGIDLLAPKGRFVILSGSGARPAFPIGPFYRKECAIKGMALAYATDDDLENYAMIINRAFEENLLHPKIAEIIPLDEIKKGFEKVESGKIWGKIIVKF